MASLDAHIESLLFWKAEPLAITELARIAGVKEEEARSALAALEKKIEGRGVVLVWNGDKVALKTSPESSSLIERLAKEELNKELGKAGLETLSVILYQGPLSRREIDYIRGVNSSFIIRHLLVRGLIERVPSDTDQRSFLYRPTFDLLSYLGISRLEELPEYRAVREEIAAMKKAGAEEEGGAESAVDGNAPVGENTGNDGGTEA